MLIVPTRRLVLLALAVAVVLVLYRGPVPGGTWGGIAIVDGALLLVALIDALAAPATRRIEVQRILGPVAVAGTTVPIRWRLTNATRRRARVTLADSFAPSLGAATRRVSVAVKGRAATEVATTLTPTRRGRFVMDDVSLRVDGPLGLMSRQRTIRCHSVLRVHPPFRSRDEAELRIKRARVLEIGLRTVRGHGGGTEFESLREYTHDDEFRRIDWAASARTGRPIVRTYRPERNQTVIVLLDNGRLGAARIDGVPRIEHALDAAIMLTAVASRLGDKVGLVAFDSHVRAIVAPARRRDQVTRVTEAVYDLEPALLESDYQGAFTETLSRFRRRAMLVVLSDLSEQAVAETLLPALPLLVRNHLVVVGAVRDPEVSRWAVASPADEVDAYRRAAAIDALDRRRRTAARLRGLGAVVVDADPGRLAPLLADAYLEVKATGRL